MSDGALRPDGPHPDRRPRRVRPRLRRAGLPRPDAVRWIDAVAVDVAASVVQVGCR